MFLNEHDRSDVSVEEALRMGGRKTLARVDGTVVHVTSITVFQLETEPPTFEVHHVSFVEPVKGERRIVAESTTFHAGADAAIAAAHEIHRNPPELWLR